MNTNVSNYNYNNAINDGITYCDEYLTVYNENGCLYVCYKDGNNTLELPYDGYFITRYGSNLIYADKKKGFALCVYDLETEKEVILWNLDVRWIICVKDICYFTCGDNNFLWQYDLKHRTSILLFENSCNYLCYGDNKIYFSNWSDNKYLYSYSVLNGQIKLEYAMNCAWVNYVNTECVCFRNWDNGKTYLLNLGTKEFRVLNTDESNYLLYHGGYIYYSNIRQGGLWRQNIMDKKDKKLLLDGAYKRLNIAGEYLYCIDPNKTLIKHKLNICQ